MRTKVAALTALALFVSVTFLTSAQPPPGAQAQDKSRERVVTTLWKVPMPVEIRGVKTKNKSTELGRAVVDDDDWFEGLTLTVTNVSDKAIVYIGGGFLFPRPPQAANAEQPPVYRSFMYGHHPEAPEAARLSTLPLNLEHGDAMELQIGNGDSVRRRLKQFGYLDSIKEVQFNIEEIYFADGSGWVPSKTPKRTPTVDEGGMPAVANPRRKKSGYVPEGGLCPTVGVPG